MSAPHITYFSDVLCIWAHVAQPRVDALIEEFGDTIEVEERFVSVFPDMRYKRETYWGNHGGMEAYNADLQRLAEGHPHVAIHPDTWTKARPATSAHVHHYLKAVQILDTDRDHPALPGKAYRDLPSTRLIRRFRYGFFNEGLDVGDPETQRRIAAEEGIDVDAVERVFRNGEAMARLEVDHGIAEKLKLRGSPSYLMNDGRQILYGNVGYRLIRANVQELFRHPEPNEASWA